MARLIYIINTSVDGYIEDATGAIDWASPDEVHKVITDLLRPIKTYLYGRRVYETMAAYWDSPVIETYPPEHRDFARVWQNAEKIVFSRTVSRPTARKTRVEREFDPKAVQELKRGSPHDVAIAGAELAGVALRADLLDECHLFMHPVIVGGGKALLRTDSRRKLELLEARRLNNGVTHLHYRIKSSEAL
ncbi:MAG: dihydrofolate reductase family protein [Candidatus Eremiobacteraeota bacterium]|nr:dihydrofolate reductase family protein [Candidatus Eremiobacteraeota bacterium]